MNLLASIFVAAIALILIYYLWFALGFWFQFQFKHCPKCGSIRSRFLGYSHLENHDYSAYRCKKCQAEFVNINGTAKLRNEGIWESDSLWSK